jgi:hypothetical protein
MFHEIFDFFDKELNYGEIVDEFRFTLHINLIRSKLEHASVFWNSITSTDANKLERIQQKFAVLCFNCFFPNVHHSHAYTLHAYEEEEKHMRYSLFKFALLLNSVHFWNLFFFESLLTISETFLCSISTLKVKIALLLDAVQLIKLWKLTYLEPKQFPLITFYNGVLVIIKIFLVFKMHVYFFFSYSILVYVIDLLELSSLPA